MTKENRFEMTNKAVEKLMGELINIVDKKSLTNEEKKSLSLDILINFFGNAVICLSEYNESYSMKLLPLILNGISNWFKTFYGSERTESQTLQ